MTRDEGLGLLCVVNCGGISSLITEWYLGIWWYIYVYIMIYIVHCVSCVRGRHMVDRNTHLQYRIRHTEHGVRSKYSKPRTGMRLRDRRYLGTLSSLGPGCAAD